MRKNLTLAIIVVLLCACATQVTDSGTLEERVEQSYAPAEQWLLSNVKDNGVFVYEYDPRTDSYSTKNNAIRQLMAARLLAELAREDSLLLPLHRHNMGFYLEHWYQEDENGGYVFYNDKSKLGANAMLLRTLAWSPDFGEHADKAERLADGILHLMDEQGGFHPWYKEPGYEYDKDYLLTFYSGEALLALAEYYQVTKDERILEAAERSQRFYINRYVTELEQHYYPAYVPWHAQSLYVLWTLTGKEEYVQAMYALNDKLLEMQDTTEFVGRFYNPETPHYGKPHGSSDGVYTEGLAYAYKAAVARQDTEQEARYKQALILSMNNLEKLQYDEDDETKLLQPHRAIGGFRISVSRPSIRVDTVQHIMDAYRMLLDRHDIR